jgi:hypothetical protein
MIGQPITNFYSINSLFFDSFLEKNNMCNLMELTDIDFQLYLMNFHQSLTISRLNFIVEKRKNILFELNQFLEEVNHEFLFKFLTLEEESTRREMENFKLQIENKGKEQCENKMKLEIQKVSKKYKIVVHSRKLDMKVSIKI